MRILNLCFAITALFGAVIGEQVWLRDLNSDLDKRNLEIGGLPSNLKFALIRQGNDHGLELNLEENRRLGANAPVYEVKQTSDGKQQLVKKNAIPITQTKFYQDKKVNGVFMVTCKKQRIGACQRMVEGLFDMDGENYNLTPSEKPTVLRNVNTGDVPHELVPNKVESMRWLSEMTDFAEIEDGHLQQRNEFLEKLTGLLNGKQADLIARILRGKYRRQKRAGATYAVDVVAAIDPALWKKYYDDTTETTESAKQDEAELKLRQYLSHIYNGVSLRYQSIDDAELDIYVTLSGFIFYTAVNSSSPVPPSAIVTENGVEYADCDVYLDNLVTWARNLENLPDNDHIAVFTGYDLYSSEPKYNLVAGYAWVGGVCNDYRVSVNEAGTYFETVSVAAHELGHNLNASHDNATDCPTKDSYIMAPSTANFELGEPYSVNPWRFSTCSIDSFKSFIDSLGTGSGNCLIDAGSYYNSSEYEDHVNTMPGELYTVDEQCELLRGDNSVLYTEITDSESEEICRTMACIDENNYYAFYAAARGTPCGPASENKWCIEGLCVSKTETNSGTSNETNTNTGTNTDNTNTGTNTDNTNTGTDTDNTNTGTNTDNTNTGTNTDNTNSGTDTDNTNTGTNTDNTNTGTNTDNTNTGTNTDNTNTGTNTDNTGGSEECADTGYFDGTWTWSCDELNTYFKDNFNAETADWCQDTTNGWANYCCAMCSGASTGTGTDNTGGTDTGSTGGTDTGSTGGTDTGSTGGTDTGSTGGTDTGSNGGNKECIDIGYFDGAKTWSCTKLKRYFKNNYNARPKDWCLDTYNGWADYCCEMCSAYVK